MGTDIHPYAEVRKGGKWERAYISVPRDRNYQSFAILAGVRNGYGFAGVRTGEELLPISEPRGLPADIAWTETLDNDAIVDDYDDPKQYVNFGDHSFSWVKLAELLAYNLDRDIKVYGVISKQQEADLASGVLPKSWCGGKSPMTDNDVHAEWPMPLRKRAMLIGEIIDALKPLGAPDDVRIVFGFDS